MRYVIGQHKGYIAALLAVADEIRAQVSSHNELAEVCRASVAAMMGHDIKIVRLDKVEGNIAYVSYSRPSDHKVWKNRCRLEGPTLVWGTIDAFGPGTGYGPWRNRPGDEKVTFKLSPNQITVIQTFADGSNLTKSFPRK
jgi:hypothetical protein